MSLSIAVLGVLMDVVHITGMYRLKLVIFLIPMF